MRNYVKYKIRFQVFWGKWVIRNLIYNPLFRILDKNHQEIDIRQNRFQVNTFKANSLQKNFSINGKEFGQFNWTQMAKEEVEAGLILIFLLQAAGQIEVSFMGMGIQEWKENLWWADNEFRFICGEFELLGRHPGRGIQQAD